MHHPHKNNIFKSIPSLNFVMKGILAFGDSITFGMGVVPSNGSAQKLKEDFESQDIYNALYNLGIPGDSSKDLLNRFETEANARIQYHYPDNKYVILIAIGTNDSRGLGSPDNTQTSLEDYKSNVEKIVKLAKNHTNHIIIISIPPVDESLMPFEDTYFSNEIIEQFNKTLQQISEKNNLLFCDVYKEFEKREDYTTLFVDGLHPNNEGYFLMYKFIKKFLVKNNIIK